MDTEFRVAFRPGRAKGAIYVSRAEPGAVRALPEAGEHRQVVLAARLVTDDVEQVRLERLPALAGQLTEPVTQFFRNVTNLKGNHACNSTCMVAFGARTRRSSFVVAPPPGNETLFIGLYPSWQDGLDAIKGIYLLVDKETGEQYVGSAKGGGRLLGPLLRLAPR
jgi:hypothetical protein